jgi:hypothetical protein
LGGHFDQSAGSKGAPSISSAIPLPIGFFRLFGGAPEMAGEFPTHLINMIYQGMPWRPNQAFLKFSLLSGKAVSQSRHDR